ncbi:MAG: FecR domain-containing protein [Anaerovoracaceae bacterium]
MGNFLKKTGGRLLVLICCVILITGLLTGCGGNAGGSAGSGNAGDSSADGSNGSGGQAGDSARTIVVEETNGTTVVLDESKASTNAYKGMHLFSGSDVTVQLASDMTMLLDMDKYLYAEEKTHFWLEASGSSDSSKTVIFLDEGAVLNRIKNPLENGSVYQVDTPNSTMAVRGTVFLVRVWVGTDGQVYSDVQVLDGSVKIDLKNTQGEYNGVSETFTAGQAAAIRGNTDYSEFIVDENGNITASIDYESLPPKIAKILLEYLDDGETLSVDRETLEAIAAPDTDENGGNDGNDNPTGTEDTEGTADETHVHNWQTVTVRQATCTQQGLVLSVCSVCGQTGNQRTIAMKDHTEPSGWTVKKKATCTETGTETKSCMVCGKLLKTRKTDVIDHKAGEEQTIDATCTEAGSVKVLCTVCGHTLEEHILEALGHQPGDWVVTQAAGYGVEGSQTQYCTVCGEALNVQTIPALVIDWVVPSCSHEEQVEEVVKVTCTVDGKIITKCASCGAVLSTTITTEAKGHTEETIEAVEATCTTAGSTEGSKCSVCGEILVKPKEIPAGHTLDEEAWDETKAATCEEAGEEIQYCTVCNSQVTREIPALGHDYNYIHSFTPYVADAEGQTETVKVIKLCVNKCGFESSEEHTATYKSGVWICSCGEELIIPEQ